MRICIEKSTGKLIEAQSGGETHPSPKIDDEEYALINLDTLRQNAIRAEYNEKNIEVTFVTDAKFEAIMEANKPIPTKEQLYEAVIKAKETEILRRQAIAEIEAEKIIKERSNGNRN